MRSAMVKPKIAPSMFPAPKPSEPGTPQPNTSRRRAENTKVSRKPSTVSEDFGDGGIDDDELMKATSVRDLEFDHIENYANPMDSITWKNTTTNKRVKENDYLKPVTTMANNEAQEPKQFDNGKWACNHKCKEKNSCKHLCCKEGVDKPPKRAKAKRVPPGDDKSHVMQKEPMRRGKETQTKLQISCSKRKSCDSIEELDLTQTEKKSKTDSAVHGPKEYLTLYQLHKNTQENSVPSSLPAAMPKKPMYCYSEGGDHILSFMNQPIDRRPSNSSDYGHIPLDDFSYNFGHAKNNSNQQQPVQPEDVSEFDALINYSPRMAVVSRSSDLFGDDDSLLEDAMIGIADSEALATAGQTEKSIVQSTADPVDVNWEEEFQEDDVLMAFDLPTNAIDAFESPDGQSSFDAMHVKEMPPQKQSRLPFLNSTSSPRIQCDNFKSTIITQKGPDVKDIKQDKIVSSKPRGGSNETSVVDEYNLLDLSDVFEPQPVKNVQTKKEQIPDGFKDLEPWLFEEFGDIVELVDE